MRKHSFPPVVDHCTRLLILGSLPGDRSLAAARYYANPQNQFWQLLSPVVGRNLLALEYEARLAALSGAGIGLWDVVAAAHRQGSTDAAIRNAAPNDLAAMIATLPALKAIAFNGGTAHRLGAKQLGVIAERLTIILLPSSSPLHTIGLVAKQPAWTALRAHI